MKNHLHQIVTLMLFFCGSTLYGQYGLGTNNPNASAALEILSPDKGLLIPRLALTASNTFAPVSGAAAASHNGLLVYNTTKTVANGLTGEGFYVWQGGAAGHWFRLTTSQDAQAGTATNTTLRWDGTHWVENATLVSDGAAQASVTTNLAIGGNQTIAGTQEVTGNSSVTANFAVGGLTTLTGTTTINNQLVDASGDAGSAGQVLSATATGTDWVNSFAPTAGTVTNTTLRWDGTNWVENTTLVSDGAAQASVTTNLAIGGNQTIAGTQEVTGNSSVTANFAVGGITTLTGTTTLHNQLVDASGDAGSAGQVLSATVTGTDWINSFAPAAGTATHTTLRWDGTHWVENATLVSDGSTTATLSTDLVHDGNQTVSGTLSVSGNSTLTADLVVSGATTAQATTVLQAALVDSLGNAGSSGQVLSSTGTSTQWTNANSVNIETLSATGTPQTSTGLLLLTPSGGGADMTVSLAAVASYPTGFTLKIRRNEDYTGTNDSITLDPNGAETVDGQLTRTLNVGYQSLTLVNTGNGWVTIE